MKKKPTALLLAFCSAFVAVGWTSCSLLDGFLEDGDGENETVHYKVATDLDNAVANISAADNLAIVKREGLTSTGTAISTMSTHEDQGESHSNELVFAKVEKGEISEVKFQKEAYAVSQSDFNAEVYKMKVAGDFTFVAYISSNIRKNLSATAVETKYDSQSFTLYRYESFYMYQEMQKLYNDMVIYENEGYFYDRTKGVWSGFDEKGYITNEYMQSYAIYNPTGKIYSMSKLPAFDVVGETIAVRVWNDYNQGYAFYALSVDENNNLVIEDVLPNRDVRCYNLHKDPYGWRYVYNSSVSQIITDKKIIYHKGDEYLFDEDGYAYTVTGNGGIVDKKMVNGVPTALNGENIYGLKWARTWEYGSSESPFDFGQAIINGFAIGSNDYNLVHREKGYNIYFDGRFFRNQYNLLYKGCINGEENNIRYCRIDWSQPFGMNEEEWDKVNSDIYFTNTWSEPILENVTHIWPYWVMQDYEITCLTDVYMSAGLTGTEYYQLVVSEDGMRLEAKLIAENTYDENCFVIEPLN